MTLWPYTLWLNVAPLTMTGTCFQTHTQSTKHLRSLNRLPKSHRSYTTKKLIMCLKDAGYILSKYKQVLSYWATSYWVLNLKDSVLRTQWLFSYHPKYTARFRNRLWIRLFGEAVNFGYYLESVVSLLYRELFWSQAHHLYQQKTAYRRGHESHIKMRVSSRNRLSLKIFEMLSYSGVTPANILSLLRL